MKATFTAAMIAIMVAGGLLLLTSRLPANPEGPSGDSLPAAASNFRTSYVPAYPLKVGPTNRYLVDANGNPFLLIGDSPQSLIGRMSTQEAELYLSNREKYGINALWVNLLCNDKTGCNPDGRTNSGLAPFLAAADIATPNPRYFAHVDDILKLCAEHHMVVLLNVLETDGWLGLFRQNGATKAEAYGHFLGTRYRNVPNIIWMYGNDFQSWTNFEDDHIALAVAKGIGDTDPNHLQTTELNYLNSASLDDQRWNSIISLDGVYTYFPTYGKILQEYNRSDFRPIFMEEASYEFENLPNTSGGSPSNLRRQEYWTMLSGAAGQLYGSHYTWKLPSGWQTNLDTPGILHLALLKALFQSWNWQALIPDQHHQVVVAGNGDAMPVETGSVAMSTYLTAARTADGELVVAFMPTAREIIINMATLAGPSAAYWFDPTSGIRHNIGASLPNIGPRKFAPPAKNGDGEDDWVLVIQKTRTPERE